MGNGVSHSFGLKPQVSPFPVGLTVAIWEPERKPSFFSRRFDARKGVSKWFAGDKEDEEVLHELFCPLKDEEEKEVLRAWHDGEGDKILVLHEPSNIVISAQDIQCLSPRGWLNDEVINLYLELLKEREKREPKKFLKCHFFNTFFYKKVANGKMGYDFKSVRRWTSYKKLEYYLIDCHKIFFPIHQGNHWCLAVADTRRRVFHYLDSLGGLDTNVLKILAIYLTDEAKDKNGLEMDIMSWKQESIADIPRQNNGWDCGMFMLKYCDFYSRGSSLRFGQEHMYYFRMRTTKEILNLRAE